MQHPFIRLGLIALLIGSVSAHAAQSTLEYDPVGNLKRITNPLGAPTETDYDSQGRPSQTRPAHPTAAGTQGSIAYVQDGRGQLKTLTDPRGLVTTYLTDGLGNTTQQTSPDTGTTSYQYNAAGLLTQKTDARGKLTTYTWDALGRLLTVVRSDETITLTYDQGTHGTGRLTGMTDASGQTSWEYDAHGRVLRRSWQGSSSGAPSFTLVTGYDSAGRLAHLTYPSGRQIDYAYDTNGQLTSLAIDGTSLLSNITYAPFGPVTGWTWNGGQTYSRSYDLNGRMTAYSAGASSSSPRSLTWDAASRLTQVSQGGSTFFTAAYDNLDRLTSHVLSASNYGYQYDANGNRTNFAIGGTGYTLSNASTSNRLSSTTGPSPAYSLTYDAAGNPTSDGTRSYTWSDGGALKTLTYASTTTNYTYNGLAQRLRKGSTAYNGTRYVYDEAGHLIGEYDDTGNTLREYVWLGDTPVALAAPAAYSEVVRDDLSPNTFNKTGTWTTASTLPGAQGGSYTVHVAASGSSDKGTWGLFAYPAQTYNLYARWVQSSANSPNATYTVTYGASGSTQTAQVTVDQRSRGGEWVYLGTWYLGAGAGNTVSLAPQPDGQVIADAIKLVPANSSASLYKIQTDQIDTPRVMLNAANQVVWRWDGEAFGLTPANEDPDGDGILVTNNLRFPGQVFDKESNLHYNWNRYYDPQTGRYISSDPIGLAGGSLSTYNYVGANPLGVRDPTGLVAGADDVVIGGGVIVVGCLLTPACRDGIGSAMSNAARDVSNAASKAGQAIKDACPCFNYKNVYEANDGKHGASSRSGSRGTISPEPSNGALALENSTPVGDARIGYDPTTRQLVIFRNHYTDEKNCIKYWHGYVVTQQDLTAEQWKAGRGAGFPNWPRKPR